MGSQADVQKFFTEFRPLAASFTHEVVLCPSFVFIDVASRAMPSTVKLGAQDVSQFGAGPYTGEIHAGVLSNFGVKYCIVGHVERRTAGETDEMINKKVKNCIANGITPIICVGDTLAEYQNNMTRVVIERQMREALNGVKEFDRVIFAYQPIWSIGTGHYTSGEYTDLIIDFMRKHMQKLTGVPMAGNITMLYGGGVTLSNAREYLERPEIDGIMWGLATTKAENIAAFVNVPFTRKGMGAK